MARGILRHDQLSTDDGEQWLANHMAPGSVLVLCARLGIRIPGHQIQDHHNGHAEELLLRSAALYRFQHKQLKPYNLGDLWRLKGFGSIECRREQDCLWRRLITVPYEQVRLRLCRTPWA